MANNFEEIQKVSKDQLENSLEQRCQRRARLPGDRHGSDRLFSKRSMETTSSHLEKLFGARSLDTAIQLQTEFAKTSVESFVAQATKIGEIYRDIAKEAFRPVEAADEQGPAGRPSGVGRRLLADRPASRFTSLRRFERLDISRAFFASAGLLLAEPE